MSKVDHRLYQELQRKQRDCEKDIVGLPDVVNDAHARAAIAVIEAFSKGKGFIYIEAHLPNTTNKPSDIVLCDESLGVVVFEVKGYEIKQLRKYLAGKLTIEINGTMRNESPWDQARVNMFDIENAFNKRNIHNQTKPWFSNFAFFPHIEKKEWTQHWGKEEIQLDDSIFQDDSVVSSKLRGKISIKIKHKSRLNKDTIDLLKETFGDSEVINSKRDFRKEILEEAVGYWIDEQENTTKNLSSEQQDLSRIELDGKPRLIRGVAGSGKTIVLSNWVARAFARAQKDLFGRGSEYKILVLCFNKSFVPFLRDKIKVAYESQNNSDVKIEDHIKIQNIDAFFYEVLVKSGIVDKGNWKNYKTQEEKDINYGTIIDSWSELGKNHSIQQYDAIFIDEGQDLSENEYRLLLNFARENYNKTERNLCIFYDDAQNIYGRIRPNWSKIGINVVGDRSRVMKECFRSTKETITVAFNVLLGAASDNPTQVKTKGFADAETMKRQNLIEELDDGYYAVHFAPKEGNWPIIMNFDGRQKEEDFVIKELIKLIGKEEVRPQDILILSYTKDLCESMNAKIQDKLVSGKYIQRTIRPYHDEDKGSSLFLPKCLTISTIHSAKGYDAPIVFFMGIDNLFNDEKGRATFYVGTTRAKYRVYLTGCNNTKNTLLKEAEKVVETLSQKYI